MKGHQTCGKKANNNQNAQATNAIQSFWIHLRSNDANFAINEDPCNPGHAPPREKKQRYSISGS